MSQTKTDKEVEQEGGTKASGRGSCTLTRAVGQGEEGLGRSQPVFPRPVAIAKRP